MLLMQLKERPEDWGENLVTSKENDVVVNDSSRMG
jgi:hypothetical protein